MSEKNIFQRINAVQQEISYLQKDKDVSTGNGKSYTALTHDKVVGSIRGLLVKHGIATIPRKVSHVFDRHVSTVDYNGKQSEKVSCFTQLEIEVEFVNIDDPKDSVKAYGVGYGTDSQDKGAGKAMSYAVKYAMLKTFMIESGDDEEARPEETRAYVPVDYKERDALIVAIKTELRRLTLGMDLKGKVLFMKEKCDVCSSDDLKRKLSDELKNILGNLKSLETPKAAEDNQKILEAAKSVKWDE